MERLCCAQKQQNNNLHLIIDCTMSRNQHPPTHTHTHPPTHTHILNQAAKNRSIHFEDFQPAMEEHIRNRPTQLQKARCINHFVGLLFPKALASQNNILEKKVNKGYVYGELRWLKTTVTYRIPIYFLLVARSYGGEVQFIEYSNNRPSYFPWQSRTNDRQTRRLSSLLCEIKLIWRGKKCHERCLRTLGTGTGWLAAGAAVNNFL